MTNEEFIKSVSLEGEIWKDIKGYSDRYIVSNLGRIASLKRYVNHSFGTPKIVNPRILNQKNCKTGYKSVTLYKDNRKKSFSVHRLVADAFIPNPENKPCIDHLDRDKTNNSVYNLRWCTMSENMLNPLTRKILCEARRGMKIPSLYHPVVA